MLKQTQRTMTKFSLGIDIRFQSANASSITKFIFSFDLYKTIICQYTSWSISMAVLVPDQPRESPLLYLKKFMNHRFHHQYKRKIRRETREKSGQIFMVFVIFFNFVLVASSLMFIWLLLYTIIIHLKDSPTGSWQLIKLELVRYVRMNSSISFITSYNNDNWHTCSIL